MRDTIFCFLLLSAMVSGCGGHAVKQGAVVDTLAADTSDVCPLELLSPTPDTMYASAQDVKFTVETLQCDVDSRIDDSADMYAGTPGSFTFRKGSHRIADFCGVLDTVPTSFKVEWVFRTAEDYTSTSVGSWGGGTGWTGQPIYVQWPDEVLGRMRAAGVLDNAFSGKEIMVGSLYGSVYFIDYESGLASRDAIPVGNPIKGTISLDPTINGNLYVGHGVPARRPFGAVAIDLFTNKIFHTMPEDPKSPRRWGAYDSSPVRVGQFLFRPGENGSVYKYSVAPGNLTLHSVLRYTVNGVGPGIESSMSVYGTYGYTADNGGNILCIDLNTMRPVWMYRLGDDTDATPVVVQEDGKPSLYVGSEIDLQNVGFARFVKLDALTGQLVWEAKIAGRRVNLDKKHFDGGFYATALVGHHDCCDLVMVNCVKNTSGQNGAFVALDRKTGEVVYETPLRCYAWSSPVGFVGPEGKMYVVTADCAGSIYVIEGRTGRILVREHIGANFESSPVVVGSTIVIGSRGNSIYKIRVV